MEFTIKKTISTNYTWICPKCNKKTTTSYEPTKKSKCLICETKDRYSFLIGAKILDIRVNTSDEFELDMIEVVTIDGREYGIYGIKLSCDVLASLDILEH